MIYDSVHIWCSACYFPLVMFVCGFDLFFFFIGDFHISGGLALCFIPAYHKCPISSIFELYCFHHQ